MSSRFALAVVALAVGSCKYARPANVGDDDASTSDTKTNDSPTDTSSTSDAPPPPAVPTYGAQIDRVGRPLINVALNHSFDTNTTTANNAKDSYNTDTAVASWSANYTVEIAKNLAFYDALDTISGTGCGNQLLWNNNAGGTPNVNSYHTLASLLADDRLYVDTSKTTCSFYLAVEYGVATGAGSTTCGGMTPSMDVVDVTYSTLLAGVSAFSTDGNFTPLYKDNAPPHTDLLTAFPFLGAPL